MSDLTPKNINDVDWNKDSSGLTPAIVQHYKTGQILMMGYMNADSLKKTFDVNKVTFFSRKTQMLWTKGLTSGNILEFISAELDCDQDTILVQANPKGATCHTGDYSCFKNEEEIDLSFLNTLTSIIQKRKNDDPNDSYTAELFSGDISRMCQKVGEEGVEVSLAGMKNDKEELLNESADLIFHLMVLLEKHELSIQDVIEVLKNRH